MVNKLLVVITFITMLSCKNDKRQISEVPYYKEKVKGKSLSQDFIKAIKENDEKLYNSISIDATLAGNIKELLYYSLIMANKNNSAIAHYNIYFSLNSKISKDIEIDNKTKNLSLYYLIKSYELGYKKSIYDINEMFGKNKSIPKSNYFLIEYYK